MMRIWCFMTTPVRILPAAVLFLCGTLFMPLPMQATVNMPPEKTGGPQPPGKDPEDKGPCPLSSNGTQTGNDCLSFRQPFGRSPWIAGAEKGALAIYEADLARLSFKTLGAPTLDDFQWMGTLGKAGMFRYDHVIFNKIVNRDDFLKEITIEDALGRQTVYRNGKPVQLDTGRNRQCFENADGTVVEMLADRTKIYYSFENEVYKVETPAGVVTLRADFGINVIRVDGVIRQVWSKADGLLDIVTLDTKKVCVSWYAPSVVSASVGSSGLYSFSGAPFRTFTFKGTISFLTQTDTGGDAGNSGNFLYTSWSVSEGLTLVERFAASAQVFQHSWLYNYDERDWSFARGSIAACLTDKLSESFSDGISTMSRTVEDSSGHSIRRRERYRNDVNGARLLERAVVGTNGTSVLHSRKLIEQGENTGRTLSTQDERGHHISYAYDVDGRTTQEVETVHGVLPQVTVHEYAEAEADGFVDRRPRRTVVTCDGVIVSDTRYEYSLALLSGRMGETVVKRDPISGIELETLRIFYNPSVPVGNIARGRLAALVLPDGSATSYVYQEGENGSWTETIETGFWDKNLVTLTENKFTTIRGQSVRTVNTHDSRGDIVRSERYVHTGQGFSLAGWETHVYDAMHNVIRTEKFDGMTEEAAWIDTTPLWEQRADGSCVTNTFDFAKRVASSSRYTPFGCVTKEYAYDASDHELSRSTLTNGSLCYTETREYDPLGRVVRSVDGSGRVTTTGYSSNNRVVTRTDPSGAVTISTYNTDGSPASVTGTLSAPYFVTYGVEPADGTTWRRTTYGSPESPSYEEQVYNGLGQLVSLYKPAFGGGERQTLYEYNDFGQLVAEDTPGEPLTEYAYAYGTALAGGGCLSCSGGGVGGTPGDRVAVTQTAGGVSRTRLNLASFAEEPDGSVWEISLSVRSSSDPSLPAITNALARKLFPLDPDHASETRATDPRGNVTLAQIAYDPVTLTRTTAVTAPYAEVPALTVETDGLTVLTVSPAAVTNAYAYDALRRRVSATDGRGNTSLTHYDALGRVGWTEDAASNRTAYAYDAAGRRTAVTDPLGNVTHTAYDAAGHVTAVWGASSPAAYEYDAFGRMTAMATTRNPGFDFSTVTNSSLFLPNASLDVTRWLYDEATGLLTNKVYADGLGPAYDYTPAGRLSSRLWARGVTTAFTYDAFGQAASVTYSDSTPSVSYAYDALGRVTAVTDASGVRALAYTPDGLPLSDALAFGGSVFTVSEKYDIFGRNEGYALSNLTAGAEALLSETVQTYDTAGRLERVEVGGAGGFAYARLPGSGLVTSLAMPNGVTRETVYNPFRNLPASVTHTNATGTVLARRAYAYDAVGRLTGRTQYRLGDESGRTDAFGYNARSELASAAFGTNAYAYAFDPIGNRMATAENTESTEYIANGLNQYASVSNFVSSVPSCAFVPEFDDDGNQTLVRTATGIWRVIYNGENRPVLFSNDTAVIEMAYDHMGRRFEYKETVNDTLVRHERCLYRGYLQLAALNLLDASSVIRTIVWDPEEPVATRPLCLSFPLPLGEGLGDGPYTVGFDQTKNVTELFDVSGNLAATYDYAPFGAVTAASGPAAALNPLTFSSEVSDTALDLVYYNYRHLNTLDGRWTSRDPIREWGGENLYRITINNVTDGIDLLGLGGLHNEPPAQISMPCCGGQLFDSERSCCVNGVLTPREPQSTGVFMVTEYGREDPFFDKAWDWMVQHAWIEFPNGSTGFGPDGNPYWPHAGLVSYPDGYQGLRNNKTKVFEVKLSPCDTDMAKFLECVSAPPEGKKSPDVVDAYKTGRIYCIPFSHCETYQQDLIANCRAKARR